MPTESRRVARHSIEPAPPSNSLVELAREIKTELDGVVAGARTTLEHAIKAGNLFIKAKREVQHGQWRPWLRDYCGGVSERTAQKYMMLARYAAVNPPFTADLGIEAALKAAALPSCPNTMQRRLEAQADSTSPSSNNEEPATETETETTTEEDDTDIESETEAAAATDRVRRNANNRRWLRAAMLHAKDMIDDADLADGELTPELRQSLREVIEPGLLPTLREAGEAALRFADFLERLAAEPELKEQEETTDNKNVPAKLTEAAE